MNRPPTSAATATAGECGNCGTHKGWVLHHMRLRGIHRRLCTSCVLRLHPGSFCPSCFVLYDPQPPHPTKRVSCSSCLSFAHAHCVKSLQLSQSPYLCPPCADSNFSFFDVTDHVIDKKLSLALLCAAKIASASMAKAVIVARSEAERRVREAVVAKKRAREALEHVASLDKEKLRKKELQLLHQQQHSMKIEVDKRETAAPIDSAPPILQNNGSVEKVNDGNLDTHLQNNFNSNGNSHNGNAPHQLSDSRVKEEEGSK
ncbi:hypothetical protein HS088_TW12G01141 [Tripterygium wilfordii]|uniref:DNA binding protein n=1 Tax=Tripterygium wilfordii TaxID=458696 RepID=A0A7J7D0Q2_TRIWF|nr:uncharacterized protein LOC120011079 [Tripterygium wilfordii]KAF5739927.1 hypothetical protein HS088_TW12G01141 [Tripterygium wilfordii]